MVPPPYPPIWKFNEAGSDGFAANMEEMLVGMVQSQGRGTADIGVFRVAEAIHGDIAQTGLIDGQIPRQVAAETARHTGVATSMLMDEALVKSAVKAVDWHDHGRAVVGIRGRGQLPTVASGGHTGRCAKTSR